LFRPSVVWRCAILGSLPGILAFQIAVGIPLSLLLAAVLGFYAVFHLSESVQWAIGIPAILVAFVSLLAASVGGCYTGARIGWLIAGGTPCRAAIAEQKIIRYSSSWFRKGQNWCHFIVGD
jgi:uncharacterized membrane protein YedE/YeeE